jgi:SAM-dependent methyltransferase
MEHDEQRSAVREHYAEVAEKGGGCGPGCCNPGPIGSLEIGYAAEDLEAVPEGANLGLGCGNPQAIAALAPGEVVLDLGSGAGFDCLLAARQVGPSGKVIGVDMTPEMIARARENVRKVGAMNVELRLGEIEHLPVADASVDVILSNCVLNLSPDKPSAFREAYRVLRAGGRLAIADVVALRPIPEELASPVELLTGCVSGAARADEIRAMLVEVGFGDVRVDVKPESRAVVGKWFPGLGLEDVIASATIQATKTGASCCGPSCCP